MTNLALQHQSCGPATNELTSEAIRDMWRQFIFMDGYYNKANRCEISRAVISPASCLARIVSLDVFVTPTVEMPQTAVVCPTLGSILCSTPLNPPQLALGPHNAHTRCSPRSSCGDCH